MTLTTDQRWLLRTVGGWQISWALTDPSWWDHLMQSQAGGTGSAPGAPDGAHGYQCGRGKIVSPWTSSGEPVVVITKAQFLRFQRELPQAIKDELRSVESACSAERRRSDGWCWCPTRTNRLIKCTGQRDHHPTDDESDSHYAEERRLNRLAEDVLLRALGFGDAEPVGQLDLFEVAS